VPSGPPRLSDVGSANPFRPGLELNLFTLWPEHHEQFDRIVIRVSHPVGHPGVELRRFPPGQDEVAVVQHDTEATTEHVQPLKTFMTTGIWLRQCAAGGGIHLVGLDPAGLLREWHEDRAMAVDHPGRFGAARLPEAHQLVERDIESAGERKQLRKSGMQLPGLQPGQRARGDTGDGREIRQPQGLLVPQCPQSGPHLRAGVQIGVGHRHSFPICNPLCKRSCGPVMVRTVEPEEIVMGTVFLILTGVLVLFLLVVGPLRIMGYAPIKADAAGLGIPYVVYRWLGVSEVLCAGLLIIGLTVHPLTAVAAGYLSVGAGTALVLHVRAGDPANRWAGAFAAAVLAAAVGVLSLFQG
jgi:hypothetical protein